MPGSPHQWCAPTADAPLDRACPVPGCNQRHLEPDAGARHLEIAHHDQRDRYRVDPSSRDGAHVQPDANDGRAAARARGD